MKKTAFLIILLTIFAKFIGFFREITLSYFYGTSNISDAYLISVIIPTVIFAFIGSAISTGYIPMYNKVQKNQGIIEADLFTNKLINLLLVCTTLLLIMSLLFTEELVLLFASGFDNPTLGLATRFTKISIFGIYFVGLGYIMKSYLQIKGNYYVPALSGIPLNIISILSIYLSSNGNIIILAIGMVFAMFAHFIFMVPFVLKEGFFYKFIFDIKAPEIKKLLMLTGPVLVGVAVNDINKIVDKTIASQIATGAISALTYAHTLNNVIQGIFVLSIATAMYPLISKMAVEDNTDGLKKTVSESINIISILIIPVTVGTMIFSEPLITVLFGRGAFGQDSIEMTSNALFYYSIGFLAFGLREVLTRPFYAMQDSLTPVINATIGVIINILLNIVLSRYLGIGGLALATSISAIVTLVLIFFSLTKKIGLLGIKDIIATLIKIICAAAVMGILSKLIFNILYLNFNQSISLVISILIGSFIYLFLIYSLKIKDALILVGLFKNRFKKS